ncbi:ABC transporter substrate-binding [Micractinium conductrix]|uniref:ABC transporter substrate-binding n=1 Tax=Micractinium conductrix TaxID=554055 RepID=A0A2P6VND1_9CHLO|nr:ABC transporter substrate-binding [Micractinium conductrix]|eukprot:PSC75612.1 ABC transporter substrate-binding [Micractinium conductrix]
MRDAAAPPQPVPVEHSSSYLLRNRRQLSADDAAELRQQRGVDEPFSGSAVEWVLRKADESLDEIEENPPEYAKVLYDLSTGPVGKAASAGVTTAAKVTVQVGAEALKAAAPVGKWALQQGVKLAVGAVAKGISSAASSGKKGGGGDKQKK